MDDGILALNVGSSSLKFGLYRATAGKGPTLASGGEVEAMMTSPRFAAHDAAGKVLDRHEWPSGKPIDAETGLRFVLGWVADRYKDVQLVGAGHRVVHGGTRYHSPALVDDESLAYLEGLSVLEPSHQPPEIDAIRAVRRIHTRLPQVAVFDTSFHRTMPELAQLYAVPPKVREAGVRAWGFHGTSYDYINRTLPSYDREARRVIVGHLGSGSSMCAILDGKSIATTMGFSGIEGLPMSTRCGAIDAGALLYLMRRKLYDPASLEKLLYHESGLLALSGVSNDVRTLLASDSPDARLALDYLVYRIVYFAGAYTALLGGLDAVVFTAGIGENAAPLRAGVCEKLAWLGLELDAEANRRNGPRISKEGSRVRAWVIPTNEEIMIARHTLALVGGKA
jgi:acetate kinase